MEAGRVVQLGAFGQGFVGDDAAEEKRGETGVRVAFPRDRSVRPAGRDLRVAVLVAESGRGLPAGSGYSESDSDPGFEPFEAIAALVLPTDSHVCDAGCGTGESAAVGTRVRVASGMRKGAGSSAF